MTKTNEEIYKSLSRCLRCATTRCGGDFRHLASDQIMQLELAPLLNRIISPPVKPVIFYYLGFDSGVALSCKHRSTAK